MVLVTWMDQVAAKQTFDSLLSGFTPPRVYMYPVSAVVCWVRMEVRSVFRPVYYYPPPPGCPVISNGRSMMLVSRGNFTLLAHSCFSASLLHFFYSIHQVLLLVSVVIDIKSLSSCIIFLYQTWINPHCQHKKITTQQRCQILLMNIA